MKEIKRITAITRQGNTEDNVHVQSTGMTQSEFIATITPLTQRAEAQVDAVKDGINLSFRPGQAKLFLASLSLLVTSQGIQVRCA